MAGHVGRIGSWILVLALLGGAPAVRAAEPAGGAAASIVTAPPPKRERSGLGLGLGAGHGVGLLGVQVRYDIALKPYLALSPFVGGGVGNAEPFSWAAGVGAGLGRRHRLAAEVGIAFVATESFGLHGTLAASRDLEGALAAVGYEHMSDGGWFQRITLGVARPFAARVPEAGWIPTVSFLFGWRIW